MNKLQSGMHLEAYNVIAKEQGAAIYQTNISAQNSTFNTIYEVSGNLQDQLDEDDNLECQTSDGSTCKLNFQKFIIDSISEENTKLTFIYGNNEDETIDKDEYSNSLSPELISASLDAITLEYTFLYLVHGSQNFVTDLNETSTSHIQFTLWGYKCLSFYQQMILEAEHRLDRHDYRDAFIFARIAYEGWLTENAKNDTEGKNWVTRYESIYKQRPYKGFEEKLGNIRNILVHSNINAKAIAKLIGKLDVETQLNLIKCPKNKLKSLASKWYRNSKLSDINIYRYR